MPSRSLMAWPRVGERSKKSAEDLLEKDVRDDMQQIAAESGVSPVTVSRVLRRLGLNKLSALEPAEPVRRYEREIQGSSSTSTSRSSAVSAP